MKLLGQHFLVNRSVIKKIADALEITRGDIVIEIGAGHGELTSELVNWLIGKNSKQKLILIEKDSALAERLKEKYREDKKVETIHGDALKVLPKLINQFANQPINYKLVGNIPYYITGKLLRVIGEFEHRPERSVFTLQKEVAERLASAPPRATRLSATVQFWAEPKLVGYVSRNDFEPKPKVDSAVLLLLPAPPRKIDSRKYYRAVRVLFQQPRKTILNNLAEGAPKTAKVLIAKGLQDIGIAPGGRPQNLSIGDISKIADLIPDTPRRK